MVAITGERETRRGVGRSGIYRNHSTVSTVHSHDFALTLPFRFYVPSPIFSNLFPRLVVLWGVLKDRVRLSDSLILPRAVLWWYIVNKSAGDRSESYGTTWVSFRSLRNSRASFVWAETTRTSRAVGLLQLAVATTVTGNSLLLFCVMCVFRYRYKVMPSHIDR